VAGEHKAEDLLIIENEKAIYFLAQFSANNPLLVA
jgi:hypothetical protein